VTSRLVGLLALLVSLAVLVASGAALPAPVWRALGAWVEHVGPVVAAVSLLRVAALLAAGLLLVLRAAAAAAEAAGAMRLAVALDGALPPRMRRVLGGVAGVGAAGSALLTVGSGPAPSAADGAAAPPVVATMSPLDTATLRVDEPEATMQVVDEAAAAPAPAAPPSALPAASPAASPDEWVVEPGDSFWSIAEDVVADRLGRPGSEPEVADYWARLVDANRPSLASGDPDLIYPGQRFTLVA
jgi:hypothetical protein